MKGRLECQIFIERKTARPVNVNCPLGRGIGIVLWTIPEKTTMFAENLYIWLVINANKQIWDRRHVVNGYKLQRPCPSKSEIWIWIRPIILLVLWVNQDQLSNADNLMSEIIVGSHAWKWSWIVNVSFHITIHAFASSHYFLERYETKIDMLYFCACPTPQPRYIASRMIME